MVDNARTKNIEVVYSTEKGKALRGNSLDLPGTKLLRKNSVDLIITSPPFSLEVPKRYGNKNKDQYLVWIETFFEGWHYALKDTGSLVIDIGNSYTKGSPKRSLYIYELALKLVEKFEFCQEFYWFNSAKMPTPAEYVTKHRTRVKDSVNTVFWFAKDATNAKANNRNVLIEYSAGMKKLLRTQTYNTGKRPSDQRINKTSFLKDNGGAIPPNIIVDQPGNLIVSSNTNSSDPYLKKCREYGLRAHPARFPETLPDFFIKLCTEENDLIFDPFAGSNTTGLVAERNNRRWISCDLDEENKNTGSYVTTSSFRFDKIRKGPGWNGPKYNKWSSWET
jgi:site-specific DNA-methyltransferase (cytosine-N4-specific)